jgi:glycosyltransferase involved in cell wall biosynthesis
MQAYKAAVIIPSYKVTRHVLDVIRNIGPEIEKIYVVDDCCPDHSGQYVLDNNIDPRVCVLFNSVNKGVGGATKRGYVEALKDGMDVAIKVDGDGQMDPRLIPKFIKPIRDGRTDYTKGNRFFSYEHVNRMPKTRLLGNAALTFFTKASSGYWNIFDPNNGFTAINRQALAMLPLEKIHDRYFFESDMLFRLNSIRAVVMDVPMTAVYEDEESGLRIKDILMLFLKGHIRNFCKRIIYNYFLRDFTIASLELLVGTSFLMFGFIYGGIHWTRSIVLQNVAPSGVVMLAGLTVIVGTQLLLSVFNYDVQNTPKTPISTFDADPSDHD